MQASDTINVVARTTPQLQMYSTATNDDQLIHTEKTSSSSISFSLVELHQSVYHLHSFTVTASHYSSSQLGISALISRPDISESVIFGTRVLSNQTILMSTTDNIASTLTTTDPDQTVKNNQSSTFSPDYPSNSPRINETTITIIIIVILVVVIIIIALLIITYFKRYLWCNKTKQKADSKAIESKADGAKKASQKPNQVIKSQELPSKLNIQVNPTAIVISK